MVEIVSKVANIGDYDAYIVEITDDVQLDNEVTKALNDNFERVGEKLGEDQVYIRAYNEKVYSSILRHLDRGLTDMTLPALAVLDTHPEQLSADDRCILIELGEIESGTAVTREMDWLINHLQDEHFMRSLTWQQRKERIEEEFSRLSGPGSVLVTLISII